MIRQFLLRGRPAPRVRAGLRWMIALLALASAAPVRAETPDAVWLELPECATPPYDTRELLRTLELELGSHELRLRVQPPRAKAEGLGVSVTLPRCDADADSLTLQYRDGEGQRSRKRALSLLDVPRSARSRTLALVIAEALRPSRWPEDAASVTEPPAERAPSGQRTLAPATADPLSTQHASVLFVRKFPLFGASSNGSGLGNGIHDDPLLWPDDPYPWAQRLQLGLGAHARLVTRDGNLLPGVELNLRGHLSGITNLALEAFYSGGKTWTEHGGDLNLAWYGAATGFDARLSQSSQLRIGPRISLSRLEDSRTGTAALLTAFGGRLDFGARLAQRATLDLRMELDHSLYVKALSHDRDSLPWYGWILTWGAGVSLDVI